MGQKEQTDNDLVQVQKYPRFSTSIPVIIFLLLLHYLANSCQKTDLFLYLYHFFLMITVTPFLVLWPVRQAGAGRLPVFRWRVGALKPGRW